MKILKNSVLVVLGALALLIGYFVLYEEPNPLQLMITTGICGGILLLSLLWWAYKRGWVDWIHLPLTIAWAAIALGGEKYIAASYSLTKWEVGDAFLFGMLALAIALFVPIHLCDLSFPHLVQSARRRILAAYGFTIATLLVQCFLRFSAESWLRSEPDIWGFATYWIAIMAMLGALGYALWQLHRSTHWVPFLPSQIPHR